MKNAHANPKRGSTEPTGEHKFVQQI